MQAYNEENIASKFFFVKTHPKNPLKKRLNRELEICAREGKI